MEDDSLSVTLSTFDHQTESSCLGSEDRISVIMRKMAEVKLHIKEVEEDADFDADTKAKMLAKLIERKKQLARELISLPGGGSEV